MNLQYPTEKHKDYISYIVGFCDKKQYSLLLEGSLAKGNAKTFSDIDIVICGDIKSSDLDDVIINFDELIMSNYTENPRGIFILNYKNGINVDLDIRETVTQSELDNGVILSNFGFILSDAIARKDNKSKYLPNRPRWYKVIRLIHRSCIKYLCGKLAASDDLKQEIIEEVNQYCLKKPIYTNEIKYDLKIAFDTICNEYTVENNVRLLFLNLFNSMD